MPFLGNLQIWLPWHCFILFFTAFESSFNSTAMIYNFFQTSSVPASTSWKLFYLLLFLEFHYSNSSPLLSQSILFLWCNVEIIASLTKLRKLNNCVNFSHGFYISSSSDCFPLVVWVLSSIVIKASYANRQNGWSTVWIPLLDDLPDDLPNKAQARAKAVRTVKAHSCMNFIHPASSPCL